MSIDTDDFISGGRDALGKSLRSYRLRKGLSQKELADACGVTQATVSEIETGKGNPTLDVILKLAKALEVPPIALVGAGTVLGAMGTIIAARSVGDAIGKLLAKASDPQVHQWMATELLELAKTSIAKIETRVSPTTAPVKSKEDGNDSSHGS